MLGAIFSFDSICIFLIVSWLSQLWIQPLLQVWTDQPTKGKIDWAVQLSTNQRFVYIKSRRALINTEHLSTSWLATQLSCYVSKALIGWLLNSRFKNPGYINFQNFNGFCFVLINNELTFETGWLLMIASSWKIFRRASKFLTWFQASKTCILKKGPVNIDEKFLDEIKSVLDKKIRNRMASYDPKFAEDFSPSVKISDVISSIKA